MVSPVLGVWTFLASCSAGLLVVTVSVTASMLAMGSVFELAFLTNANTPTEMGAGCPGARLGRSR